MALNFLMTATDLAKLEPVMPELDTLKQLAYIFVALVCVFSLAVTLYKTIRGSWDGLFYIVLCFLGALFAGTLLLNMQELEYGEYVVFLGSLLFNLLPVALFFHVSRQVSHKTSRALSVVLLFGIPIVVYLVLFLNAWLKNDAQINEILTARYAPWVMLTWHAVLYIAAILRIVNVFFQMPKHMWKSAYYLLAGILTMALFAVAYLFFPGTGGMWTYLAALVVSFTCVHYAFRKAVSANVIVTSREFVMSNLSTYILVLSRRLRILDWNKKGADAFAPLPMPMYNEPFPHYKKRFVGESKGVLSKAQDQDLISILKGGVEQHYLITVQPLYGQGRKYGYVAEISEVTQLYAALRQITDIAMLDQLTGLHSRNAYMEKVKTIIAAENLPLQVIVGDVNGLKVVNDTQGHMVGDSLLSTVAKMIALNLPENAFAARLGGDEFAILLPHTGEAVAQDFINAVTAGCQKVQDPYFGTPSISWGYATMTNESQAYNAVFEEADSKMYAIKRKHFVFRSSGLLKNESKAQQANQEDAAAEPTPKEAPAVSANADEQKNAADGEA